MNEKTYLGDAVYIKTDTFGFVLTTANGYCDTNKIFLEPEVAQALINFLTPLLKKDQEP